MHHPMGYQLKQSPHHLSAKLLRRQCCIFLKFSVLVSKLLQVHLDILIVLFYLISFWG